MEWADEAQIWNWRKERKEQVDRRGVRSAKREAGSLFLNHRW
jgi:hypothetical protein